MNLEVEFTRKLYLMTVKIREEHGQLAVDKFLQLVLKTAETVFQHRKAPEGFYDRIGCLDPLLSTP